MPKFPGISRPTASLSKYTAGKKQPLHRSDRLNQNEVYVQVIVAEKLVVSYSANWKSTSPCACDEVISVGKGGCDDGIKE